MRVLIVEDSRINQFIARDTLLKYDINCDIEYAMDGEDALLHIYTQTIDLVLLEIGRASWRVRVLISVVAV